MFKQLDKHYINNDARTAGSYILKFKEALLEVADIKGRDIESFMLNSYTIAEWKYTDLFCFLTNVQETKEKRVLSICISF